MLCQFLVRSKRGQSHHSSAHVSIAGASTMETKRFEVCIPISYKTYTIFLGPHNPFFVLIYLISTEVNPAGLFLFPILAPIVEYVDLMFLLFHRFQFYLPTKKKKEKKIHLMLQLAVEYGEKYLSVFVHVDIPKKMSTTSGVCVCVSPLTHILFKGLL